MATAMMEELFRRTVNGSKKSINNSVFSWTVPPHAREMMLEHRVSDL
jgi:hypothetical protein